MAELAEAPAARRANSIGRALRVLGDRWTLLILREAFHRGTRRYQGWRDALGISDPVLAGRLRDLVDEGILERRRYGDLPPREEYRLTQSGLALWSMLVAIWAWEKSWATARAETLPDLVHKDCGHSLQPLLACRACRQPATARDTATTIAAGAGWDRSAPPRFRRRSTRLDEPSDPGLMFPETMALLGDRWSTMLLAASFLRIRRFSVFERELHISPYLLAQRLRGLVAMGVLIKVPTGARAEYRLTAKGLAFFPVIAFIVHWGAAFMPTPEGPPLTVTHVPCGARLDPVLQCDACGLILERRSVRWA